MSTVEEIIQRGSDKIIGFTFDLGEINHPKYGKANKLCGELGVALKPGLYKFPTVLKEPQLLHKYAMEVLPIARDALSTHLDEDIVNILKDYGLGVSIAHPDDLSERLLKCLMLTLTAGWGIDDLEDNLEANDSLFTYRSLNDFCSGLKSVLDDEFWNAIPNMHASVEGIKNVGKYAGNLLKEERGDDIGQKVWACGAGEGLQNACQSVLAIKELRANSQQFS